MKIEAKPGGCKIPKLPSDGGGLGAAAVGGPLSHASLWDIEADLRSISSHHTPLLIGNFLLRL